MKRLFNFLLVCGFFVLLIGCSGKKNNVTLTATPNLTPVPTTVAEFIGLATDEYDRKNYVNALEWYKKAAQIEPHNSLVREGMAKTYFAKRKYSDAVEEYQLAIDEKPANASELSNKLGTIFSLTGQWEKARDAYMNALELGWVDKNIYLELGKAQIWVSNFPEAKNAIGKALEQDQNSIEGRFLFSAVGCLDNLEFARIDMQKVKESTPASDDEKQIVADSATLLEYIHEAQLPSQKDWAGVYLAKGFTTIGYPTLAVAEVKPVIEKNPDYPQAHLLLGRANYLLQRYDDAEVSYQRFFQLYGKDDLVGWYYSGENYYSWGRFDQAVTAFSNALKVQDQTYAGVLHYKLGLTNEAQKNYTGALTSYQASVNADLKQRKAWLRIIGLQLGEVKDVDQAIVAAGKAVEQFPDDAEVVTNLGWAYLEKGNYDQSITVLEKAEKLDPDFAPIYFNLGRIRSLQGDQQAAREFYIRAVNLDTTGGISKRVEDELNGVQQ
ncbi:MAG: tetratricopeptide repeat protein [bacterium]